MHEEVLLSEDHVSRMVGKSAKTLARWRREGSGPSFIQIGKTPKYGARDLCVWILRNRIELHDQSRPIED